MSNPVLTGVLSGMVVVMGTSMMRGPEAKADPAPKPQAVDNNGRFVVAVGGTAQGVNDLVWVLHEHKPHPELKREESKIIKPDVISLNLYRAVDNGRKMQFVASRDVAYDMDVPWMANADPTPRDVIAKLKELEK